MSVRVLELAPVIRENAARLEDAYLDKYPPIFISIHLCLMHLFLVFLEIFRILKWKSFFYPVNIAVELCYITEEQHCLTIVDMPLHPFAIVSFVFSFSENDFPNLVILLSVSRILFRDPVTFPELKNLPTTRSLGLERFSSEPSKNEFF